MDAAEKADLLARITKAQSVGATILSNMTAAKKLAQGIDVDTPPVVVPPVDDAVLPGWTLTFRDEFDALDPAKWNVRDGQGNANEQSWLLARNVTITDSCLAITVKREAAGGRAFTSGYLDSIGKFSQRFGLWQVRARLNTPIGTSQGIWPAPLWLRGDTSPMEVDLIEAWGVGKAALNGYRPGSGSGSIHQDTGGGKGKVSGWATSAGVDLSKDFHTYECEWAPDFVALRIDGVEYVRATTTNAPWITGPDYAGAANMRVNCQVSKDGAYYGAPDTSTALPSTLLIDWIRVYTREG